MVSGMLTAIRDFAQDSFRVSKDETLDTLQVGELSVWIEQGPHAILAAVLRGTAPSELRTTMQEALEHVHARFGETLAAFDGDTAPFDAARPSLEVLLQSQYHRDRKKSSPMLWVLGGALVLALAVWAFFAVSARTRWHAYLNALRAEPGIVVVSAEKAGRQVRGPRAARPHGARPRVICCSGRAGRVRRHRSMAALSGARSVTRRRAGAAAAACARECDADGFADGVLTAAGTAPASWIADSQRLATMVPGVTRFEPMPLIDAEVRSLGQQLEAASLLFVRGSTTLEAGGEQVLAAQLERLGALDRLAEAANRRYTVEIVGHTDADGPDSSNNALSANRATTVRSAVESLQLRGIEVISAGAGSGRPVKPATTEEDKRLNRRVSIRVLAR